MDNLRGLRVPLIRDWLRSGESAWLHLHGDCMGPVLPGGCRILVSAAAPAGVRPGDVIVYRTDESLACHRVIWRRGRGERARFLARGDVREARDEWVDRARLLGRVVGVERGGSVTRVDTLRGRARALAATGVSLARSGTRALRRRLRLTTRPPRLAG